MNDIVELLPASAEQIAEMFPDVYPEAIAQRLRHLEVRGEVKRHCGVFFKTTRDRDDDQVSGRSGR